MPANVVTTTTTTTAPDFTDTVDQSFFIEPLGGPQHPVSYLDGRFPDSLYNKSIDSNLVLLMYTLLGPAGVASVLSGYLDARLTIEAANLSSADVDAIYSNPLAFARLIDEQNSIDTSGLLSSSEQSLLDTQAASFRNRVIDFLQAVRAGGTVQGITLAAQSGLGQPVEIVENYQALYDHFADKPLGLAQYGNTQSTEEVIILPQPDVPQSAVQTIEFVSVQGGTFSITYPVGNNNTTAVLPYNTTFDVIQSSLQAIPALGPGSVSVVGGPLPDIPVQVTFTGPLANTPVSLLSINGASLTSGIGTVTTLVIESQVGLDGDAQSVEVSPAAMHYMYDAIDDIKPVTTIVTPGPGQATAIRQPVYTILSDATLTGVIRYVTGNPEVSWPPTDNTHWIEATLEHESPNIYAHIDGNYQGFHNIANVLAYTELALVDPNYGNTVAQFSSSGATQWPAIYNNEHTGPYTTFQSALYPLLATFTNPASHFYATDAEATQAEPLTVTANTQLGIQVINDIYPIDYAGLQSTAATTVPQVSLWSSVERSTGIDYLEIDLGVAQACNFIYFEATNKPYAIDVAYDLLDQSNANYTYRNFIPVTISSPATDPSVTSLAYQASMSSPWSTIHLHFHNSLGAPVYTRFLRIGFTKQTNGFNSPFVDSLGNLLPFSIEVQNLRVGRNIA